MADRFGQQFTKTLNPEVWILDGYMPAGPDGYVDIANGVDLLPLWMKSIVRTGTGAYTVTMTDTWVSLRPHVDIIGTGSSDHLLAHVFALTASSFKLQIETS